MSQSILDTSFFDSHPRLQGVVRQFYGVLTSGVNAIFLGVLGVIVTLAIAFNFTKFAITVSVIYSIFISFVLIIVIILVLSYVHSYRIKKYTLTWDISDSSGNYGSFTLNLDIVLNKLTDTISLFFPLDDYISEVSPFHFVPLYFGYRKQILTHLIASRRVGTPLSLAVNGRRNVVRTEGNHLIEIPIDLQIDELSVVINFLRPTNTHPELLLRHGAQITVLEGDNNCYTRGHISANGCVITTYVKRPRFGCSYIIKW